MENILRLELIKEADGYVVHVHLGPNDTEFAAELSASGLANKTNWYTRVQSYIGEKYPTVKVKAVKIVVGSMILTTLPFSDQASAQTEFNMSYQFSGNASTFIKQVKHTHGNLNTVAPSFFALDANGNLVLTPQLSTTYINQMHSEGIKVVPYITNDWNRTVGRAALANRDALSKQVADAIQKYNLDGINVDIENVTEIDRENYTDFIRDLRMNIPNEKEISVAVAANPSNWKTGWQGSYDYAGLAQYADYLMLMAYDESWEGGPEGPVAGLPWVEKSIQTVLNSGVPSSKVVLGLPFYGRYWVEGKPLGGTAISDFRVKEMLTNYGGTTVYDPVSHSPEAIITIDADDPPYTFLGQTFGPGTYHIWYENDQLMQEKINLVHKYNLKGTGSWALGEEDTAIWNNYGVWLNGNDATLSGVDDGAVTRFRDVAPTHWAYDAIMKVKSNGWMVGKSPTTFAPDDHLTRAEAAVIFVKALGLEPTGPSGSSFKDVPENYWAKKEIEIAKQHGVFTGNESGNFNPNNKITREQMAAVLNNILNENETVTPPDKMPFTDVSSDHWSAPAIYTMYKQGIFSGHSDGHFGPTEHLNRAQMAVLIDKVGK